MKKRIYLDHAAATSMDPRVKKAMDSFFIKEFGNPSALYQEGRKAKKAIQQSRIEVAKIINCQPSEIIFTNGGTESDNMAIFGVLALNRSPSSVSPKTDFGSNNHIITTKIEHHAVLNPIKFLEKNGFDVTYLEVDKEGIVKTEDMKKALRPDTILVSIIYANNEIGTIQPISEIAKIIKNYKLQTKNQKLIFHVDACQAGEYLDLDVEKLGVDLMTVNGSKIYGPKGIGFLYVRKKIFLNPILYGGEQERGLRPGTENVPAIVGLATALKIAQKNRKKEEKRLVRLRDYFIKRLTKEISQTYLNGHLSKRLPNNVNISILGVEGEALVLYLDQAGIACSTGSACSSVSLEPSHVIMALGKSYKYGHGSLRFTLGRKTTKKDIDYVMKILPKVVKKLRSFSAL